MKTLSTQPISQILTAASPGGRLDLDSSWWGFGGVHGGLVLSLLTAAMQAGTQGRILQQVSGQFRRSVREPFMLDVLEQHAGRSVSWCSAQARAGDQVAVAASAVFAVPGAGSQRAAAPPMPAVPVPSECPVFTVPREFVPFARQTEIRPVGRARPFSSGPEPELIAWIRLVEDDLPPDEIRLIVLMDALAPSYAVVLDTPTPIPTLTFTVTPGIGLAGAAEPWILLRARTDACRSDGWLLERIDAWAPDGIHLGSAEQLRIVMNPV